LSTQLTASPVDFAEGEECEVLSSVTVREEEGIESEEVCELPRGTTVVVLACSGRRIRIRAGAVEGWASCRTRMNEVLIQKKAANLICVGAQLEVKSTATIRAGESLESEIIEEFKRGSIVNVLELSKENSKRLRVAVPDGAEGWMSSETAKGESLIGKVGETVVVTRLSSGPGGALLGGSSAKIRAVLEAARSGDLCALAAIVEGGLSSKLVTRPRLNAGDVRGKTALIYAAGFGNKKIVEYLLQRADEVDVNARDDTQKTALHHACKRARNKRIVQYNEVQADIVGLLLLHSATLEARDHNGSTALMFAVANGDDLVARRLIEAEANVNVRDFEGHTPLEYARTFNKPAMETLLLEAGAIAQEEDEDGEPVAALPTSSLPTDRRGAKPRQSVHVGAMSEAVDDAADASAELTVLDPAKEEEDEKTAMLKKLAVVMGIATTGVKELDADIRQARATGASDEELAGAASRLQALRARQSAREELAGAMEAKAAKQLAQAIAKAEQVHVAEDAIVAAKAVLEVEEPKERARERLQAAQASGQAAGLRDALQAAQAVGLGEDELHRFQDLLAGAESRDKAAEKLSEAMESRNVAALKFAIQQGKDGGVDEAVLQRAEAILQEEEPRQQAREALRDLMVPGVATIKALEDMIEKAKSVNLEPAEYAAAEVLLARLQKQRHLLEAIRESLEASQSADMKDIDSVRAAKGRRVRCSARPSGRTGKDTTTDSLACAIRAALAAGVPEADVHTAEVRRKRLHNTIEDIKGSIRVFCRVRPLSEKETDAEDRSITRQIDPMTLVVGEGDTKFHFDAVFTPGSQDEIFEDCRDLVQSALDGYNVTLFAYGQTGAGKTYTMTGKEGDLGVSPRTINELFDLCDKEKTRYNFTIMGSMVELYKQDLVDLLSKGTAKTAQLHVRLEKTGMVHVDNLTAEQCSNAKEMLALLEKGSKARAVAATAMNSESSRSHLLLIVQIIAVNKETKEQRTGKLLIVDLAGSERLKKSQVAAEQMREAIEINKSLTALGDVIEALTKGNKVIPYRNHKLTQLMQDALGGTSKTLMFVNCSPASSNADETLMSLKYAQRAKKITNTVLKR